MATKRSAPTDEGSNSRPFHKRPKFSRSGKPLDLGKKSFKKAHPINELKSQVRSLRRLLERDLPATIRVEKERALQTAERDLVLAEKAKKRSEIIGKWHKIRFFDRQKAERRLKKAKKEFKDCENAAERKTLKQKVEDCEVDVNYAIYYPLEVDYVPLFPAKRKQTGDAEEQEEQKTAVEREGDLEMWERVKQCAADGTLQDLREGRLEEETELDSKPGASDLKTGKKSDKSKDRPGKSKTSRTAESAERDEEGSEDETGGGFFGDD